MKCVVADHEYAVFAKIERKTDKAGDSFLRTCFDDVYLYDNTGTVEIDYVTILNLSA